MPYATRLRHRNAPRRFANQRRNEPEVSLEEEVDELQQSQPHLPVPNLPVNRDSTFEDVNRENLNAGIDLLETQRHRRNKRYQLRSQNKHKATRKATLERHISSNERQQTEFTCVHCKKKFMYRRALYNHVDAVHPGQFDNNREDI